jgi:hypothetical protein
VWCEMVHRQPEGWRQLVTTSVACADFGLHVAVTAVPDAPVVLLPVIVTVAVPFAVVMLVAEESDSFDTLHVTVRPTSGNPAGSVTIAVATEVCPFFIDVGFSDTVTLLTVPLATVITVDLDAPPSAAETLAVIVVDPGTTPVTVTLEPVVADRAPTLALLVCHVTVRPVIVFPAASRKIAVMLVVPFCTIELFVAESVIDATGTRLTVTAAVPLLPPLDAVMVAVPGATPVTTPVVRSTVATAGLSELHATWALLMTFPFASVTVAVSGFDSSGASDNDCGDTVTPPAVTVIVALPLCPSIVAVIVAVPVPTPVTVLTLVLPSTVATAGLLDVQEMARPVTMASF